MAKSPSYETWKKAYQFLLTRSIPRMSEETKEQILDKKNTLRQAQ